MKTLDELLQDNEKLSLDFKAATDLLATTQATLNERTSTITKLEASVKLAEGTITDLTGKLTTADASVKDLTAKNTDLSAKNADVNKFAAAEMVKHGIAADATKSNTKASDDLLTRYQEAEKIGGIVLSKFVRENKAALLALANSMFAS